jgi:hypothetical protein
LKQGYCMDYNVVPALPVPQPQSYSNGSKAVYSSVYMDANDISMANPFWVQQLYANNNNNSSRLRLVALIFFLLHG